MSWNQAHALLLVKSFGKTPRTRSEASCFSGSHNYNTKQNKNKLPSFIHRYSPGITSSAYHTGTRMRQVFTSLVGSFDTRASFSVYTLVPAWYLPNTKSYDLVGPWFPPLVQVILFVGEFPPFCEKYFEKRIFC
jgi:hypothetical protein